MNDIWTMIWKETKDSIFQGGLAALVRPLILMGILGIIFPLRFGLQWLALAPLVVGIVIYFPLLLVLSFVGDAIAGERERHTLETLLASRISDSAIVLGKIIVTTVYAWSTALLGLLLGLVVANLSKGQGSWQFYTHIDLLLEVLGLSLLTGLLGATGGVLISMRSATVRQAKQAVLVAMLVLAGGGVLLSRFLPADVIASLSESQLWLIAIAVLAVLDTTLLGVSLASFRRTRLMLS